MRRSLFDMKFSGDPFYGVSLGRDSVAEHEEGISLIEKSFGIDAGQPAGIDRRMIRTSLEVDTGPKIYFEIKKGRGARKTEAALLFEKHYDQEDVKARLSQKSVFYDKDLECSWSKRGFIVRTNSEVGIENLRLLHEAFKSGDVAIYLDRNGLNLNIPSRMPEDLLSSMKAHDENEDKITAAVAATGILDRLKDAGKGYYALSPAWTDFFKSVVGREGPPSEQTEHPVIFFLNPRMQKDFNYGWFTVEELDQWIEGSGPIVKSWVTEKALAKEDSPSP